MVLLVVDGRWRKKTQMMEGHRGMVLEGIIVALVVEVQRTIKELTFVPCTWPCASAADRMNLPPTIGELCRL